MSYFCECVDDAGDMANDLRAERWSTVLFELNDVAPLLTSPRAADDPRLAMIDALRIPFVAGRLASMGVDRLRKVRSELASVDLGETELLTILAVVEGACLIVWIGMSVDVTVCGID